MILKIYLTHQQIPTTSGTQELDGSSQDHKEKRKEELKSKRHQKFSMGTNWNWSQPKVVGRSGDPSSNATIQYRHSRHTKSLWISRGNYLERETRSSKQETKPPSPLFIEVSVFWPEGPNQLVNVCYVSLSRWVIQEDKKFILVRAIEGPTSSGGGWNLYYLAPKCL